MTTAICCPSTPTVTRAFPTLRLTGPAVAGPRTIALSRTLASRALHALAERWSNWRLASRERAAHKALRQMDARLLRDVGLGHLAAGEGGPSWLDLERARW